MKLACGNNIVKYKKYDNTFCSAECYLLDLVKYKYFYLELQRIAKSFISL